MGLIVPSGCIKADMGSQVASDSRLLSGGVRNFQPCLYLWRQHLQPRSSHQLPSHRPSSLRVRLPPLG